MKTRSTAASFPILTVKWPITSLFYANFEYYELSLANKTKPKRAFINPTFSETKSMKVQILQMYESISALNFLSWCIKEFTF